VKFLFFGCALFASISCSQVAKKSEQTLTPDVSKVPLPDFASKSDRLVGLAGENYLIKDVRTRKALLASLPLESVKLFDKSIVDPVVFSLPPPINPGSGSGISLGIDIEREQIVASREDEKKLYFLKMNDGQIQNTIDLFHAPSVEVKIHDDHLYSFGEFNRQAFAQPYSLRDLDLVIPAFSTELYNSINIIFLGDKSYISGFKDSRRYNAVVNVHSLKTGLNLKTDLPKASVHFFRSLVVSDDEFCYEISGREVSCGSLERKDWRIVSMPMLNGVRSLAARDQIWTLSENHLLQYTKVTGNWVLVDKYDLPSLLAKEEITDMRFDESRGDLVFLAKEEGSDWLVYGSINELDSDSDLQY
jgi:hypothetical protein